VQCAYAYCTKLILKHHAPPTHSLPRFNPHPSAFAERLPRPDHIVVVIEENRVYSQIMDQHNSGSYFHALAKSGMLFAQS
jgi:hypothetical protein